jgi:hypothetical protein
MPSEEDGGAEDEDGTTKSLLPDGKRLVLQLIGSKNIKDTYEASIFAIARSIAEHGKNLGPLPTHRT